MDRFIEMDQEWIRNGSGILKSNMDRFIGVTGYEKEYLIKILKSNMDRFIGK